MTNGLKATHGVILRGVSGALTAADRPLPLFGLGDHRRAIIHIMQEAALTTPDGDDRVRFLIATAYGDGPFVLSGELLDEANDINDAQTTFIVDDATPFVPGDVIRLDQERMLVTARNEGTEVLTVERGHGGDGRAAHDNNVAIFLQDVDWVEVANITYDNSDDSTSPHAVVVIGSTDIAPVIFDDLDVALADNTILAAPLGDRLRIRTTIAGASAPTYNYSVRVALQN